MLDGVDVLVLATSRGAGFTLYHIQLRDVPRDYYYYYLANFTMDSIVQSLNTGDDFVRVIYRTVIYGTPTLWIEVSIVYCGQSKRRHLRIIEQNGHTTITGVLLWPYSSTIPSHVLAQTGPVWVVWKTLDGLMFERTKDETDANVARRTLGLS